ncbi:MAG: hypothetical protein HYZ48_04100 [Chlamydiales bacterium]|nr:hypothetical protein [Chlamydiales bacterium]
MEFFKPLLWMLTIFPLSLFSSIQTDYAIFLFDNGDKNMIGSMLHYAKEHDPETLDRLNFRIIFMGASTDAISQEPFCHYPDKLIHYKDLKLEETIDNTWKRDQKLSPGSIQKLCQSIDVQKKVWVGVSCSIFEQILLHYQDKLEALALRDNPSPDGDTDYFRVADQIQSIANKVAVPSKAISAKLDPLHQKITVIGHGPIEDWCRLSDHLNREKIIERLGLNPQLPIIVYAGVYGDFYENSFQMFLDLIPNEPVQILIVPHPRYKGILEKKLCAKFKSNLPRLAIIGEFEICPTKNAKTLEALHIADAIFTADATSTVVFQANALKKTVLYVNPVSSPVSENLCTKKLIQKIENTEAFSALIQEIRSAKKAGKPFSHPDVFELLDMPRDGSKLLWEELLH